MRRSCKGVPRLEATPLGGQLSKLDAVPRLAECESEPQPAGFEPAFPVLICSLSFPRSRSQALDCMHTKVRQAT